jgi:transcriptional regulator with XRE-family HTH domain
MHKNRAIVQGMSDATLSDRAAEEIRAALARRRISGSELARRIGVSHTWVTNRLAGHREIGLNDLQRIADALDAQVTDLLPALAKRSTEGGLRQASTYATTGPRSWSHLQAAGHATRTTGSPPSGAPVEDDRTSDYAVATPRVRRSLRPVRLCGGVTP